MKSKIRLDRARLSSKQATKFAISIGKSMFSSAMFDFERMRSLGYNSNGADDLSVFISMRFHFDAFSTVHTNADLYAFSFVSTFESVFKSNGGAFSMKTLRVLVWTEGLNASKCMRFQTKTH